ncbi:MAG: hypothetical protein U0841_23260 [Chloroflexia bacterium]
MGGGAGSIATGGDAGVAAGGRVRGGLARGKRGLDGGDEVGTARVARGGVLGECPLEHHLDHRGEREMGGAQGRERQGVPDVPQQDFDGAGPGEGHPAGEHLVEDDRGGVEIRPQVDQAARLLGGHVFGRADPLAGQGEAGGVRQRGGDAEIGEIEGAAPVEQQVGGLHVAMDDAVAVGGVERGGELAQHDQRLGGRERPARDAVAEGAAPHERHDQVGLSPVLAVVIDREDVGVRERDGAGRAAPKVAASNRVGRQIGRQELDGDLDAGRLVDGAVDRAHRPAADVLHESIIADSRLRR